MVSFIDRVEELEALRRIRANSRKLSQMVVVYGRRRAGKTRLVQEFLGREKGAYLFIGTKSESMVLDDLSKALEGPLGFAPRLEGWDDFFEILFKHRLVVALDEFPNVLKVNPAAVAEFQRLWDKHSPSAGAMLLLIGSYVGTIKRMFFDDKKPLYGRANYKLNLQPFDFKGTCEYLKAMGIDDVGLAIDIYSVLGGVPFYLNFFEFTDPRRFIPPLFYDFPAPLGEEGKNILILEFGSEQKGYFSILEAVAEGKTAPKLISDRTGMPPDTVHKYLHELTEIFGMLRREHPVGERGARKEVRYGFLDNFFAFWFKNVYPGQRPSDEEISSYLGSALERIVLELIQLRFPGFTERGRWWSGAEEVDAVALDRQQGGILFCECKRRTRPMSCDNVEELFRRSKLVSWRKGRRQETFLVVSPGGFTDRCLSLMDERGVVHWTIGDIAAMTGMRVHR